MAASGLQHEPAHQVMDQKVHADFPLQVLRVFAAQLIHLERSFEIA